MTKAGRALGFVLLASCGGGDGTAGSVPLPQLPAEFSKVVCEKIYTCCSAAQRMGNPLIGKDQQGCQSSLSGFLSLVVPSIQDSVAKGRSTYDGDKLATCLAELRAQSCAQVTMSSGLDVSAACNGAIAPKVALGGGCLQSAECVGGSCDGADDPKLGKCVARKAAGSDCFEDEECVDGACNQGKCGPPQPGSDALCQ
jgi:hypothetical protein